MLLFGLITLMPLFYSESSHLTTDKTEKPHIQRENMSLPSNMQLNDLSTLRKGKRDNKYRSIKQMCTRQGQTFLVGSHKLPNTMSTKS